MNKLEEAEKEFAEEIVRVSYPSGLGSVDDVLPDVQKLTRRAFVAGLEAAKENIGEITVWVDDDNAGVSGFVIRGSEALSNLQAEIDSYGV